MNTLIDCGSNLGQGYLKLKSHLKIDETWKVVMFEPNPVCYKHLISKFSEPYVEIRQCAVYNTDTQVTLFIPNTDIVSQGSSLYKDMHNSAYRDVYKNSIEVNVEAVNLSRYINSLSAESVIYLKLDVEGAEYDILERMIEDDSMSRVTELFVEFHEQYMTPSIVQEHDLTNRRKKIIEYLNANQIKLHIWD